MERKNTQKKIAVVLFNLGGPDKLESVKPFLFNLFYDKNIIKLKNPIRYFIAKLISTLRNKTAQEIYSKTGNSSPILKETENQRKSLEKLLNHSNDSGSFKEDDSEISFDKEDMDLSSGMKNNNIYKVFIAMRHWHPFANEAIEDITNFYPDEIILLPLYPQFSTTTSLSSIEDFKEKWTKFLKSNKENLKNNSDNDTTNQHNYDYRKVSVKTLCCYPYDEKFIQAHVDLLLEKIRVLNNKKNFRILFSAHGLPKKIIDQGDPYEWQVRKTVEKVIEKIKKERYEVTDELLDNLDYKITYQSRVGPVEWLKPNTEDEIKLAIDQKKSLIIVPVAFVSEHVETLVELDIEYKHIADEAGIEYIRVPTLSTNKNFMLGLVDLVNILSDNSGSNDTRSDIRPSDIIISNTGKRLCPGQFNGCPCGRDSYIA